VDLIQRNVTSIDGTCDAFGQAALRLAGTRRFDRVVLLLRDVSCFERRELQLLDVLRGSVRKASEVRVVVTAQESLGRAGIEAREVRIDRLSSDDCREVVNRVFVMPAASERLHRELLAKSERIPASLLSLLRRILDDVDAHLDFSDPLGVDLR